MYRPTLFAHSIADVKKSIVEEFEAGVDELLDLAQVLAPERQLEQRLWDVLQRVGETMLSQALSLECWEVTRADIAQRGLAEEQVRLRNDKDYWMTLMTTLGPVSFFSFTYRDSSSGVTEVTRTPAREVVFPRHGKCRSSQLCLEWESRLGMQMPFRHAQQALTFFTHSGVTLEDTTISSHLLTVGQMIGRDWLYQPREKIIEVLAKRATQDKETGKPIIYLSTDAHALRRYIDDTWDAQWKMANGIRLWCVDRRTGVIIHLGGEFTWGDCHLVGETIDWLIDTGLVPRDGDYGHGLLASVVVLTDGMPWIEDYVVSKFSDAVIILDAYHVLEHLKTYTNARHGKRSKRSASLYSRFARLLLGAPQQRKPKLRRTPKATKSAAEETENHQCVPWLVCLGSEHTPRRVDVLLEALSGEVFPLTKKDAHDKLVDYLKHNAYRMDYERYRDRGYQIGSGAMESLHRTGSQARCKLPGCRWCVETSQAVFDARMLFLCGRWDEFWAQKDFTDQLVGVFNNRPAIAENQGEIVPLEEVS
jgi:hypothetical protein